MYFPGIGKLREEGVGYRWLPIPYVDGGLPERGHHLRVSSQFAMFATVSP
jgi:hypothetical protein